MAGKRTEWDYIVKVTMPKDLNGVKPGVLPAALLRPVPGGGKLHWLAAQAWLAMVAKAKSDGVELKPTSAGDTYRDYESQKRGFLSRYTTTPIAGASTRTFEGKKWYLKKGNAPMAAPGTSNHNWGLAVDVHSASEARRMRWLIANVKDFGFSWEVVPQEPWHLRYVAGDNVPAAVAAWAAANGAPAAPAAGATTPPKNDKPQPAVNDDGGDLNPGDSGPRVRALQEALKKAGMYDGDITGRFDDKLAEAVKKYKAANNLDGSDAKAGARVLNALGIPLR
jgi:hypothetical protein